jgi:hypothetical protein
MLGGCNTAVVEVNKTRGAPPPRQTSPVVVGDLAGGRVAGIHADAPRPGLPERAVSGRSAAGVDDR